MKDGLLDFLVVKRSAQSPTAWSFQSSPLRPLDRALQKPNQPLSSFPSPYFFPSTFPELINDQMIAPVLPNPSPPLNVSWSLRQQHQIKCPLLCADLLLDRDLFVLPSRLIFFLHCLCDATSPAFIQPMARDISRGPLRFDFTATKTAQGVHKSTERCNDKLCLLAGSRADEAEPSMVGFGFDYRLDRRSSKSNNVDRRATKAIIPT